ncbi:MAG: hypothetical protein QXS68_07685 [Candidatus Methanomethylicaceae archaeon]
MKLYLTFVEGPAGAGKTTYLARQLVDGELDLVALNNKRRSKKRKKTGLDAFLDHIIKLAEVAEFLQKLFQYENPEVVRVGVDRSLLSQIVYGGIRGDQTSSQKLFQFFSSLNSLVYGNLEISIDFTFIIPRLETLKLRRSSSGKEYPYDPDEEIRRFELLASELKQLGFEVRILKE